MGNQCLRCLDMDEFHKEIFIEDGIVFDTENSLQFEIEKESLISEEQRFLQQKSLFHYFTQHYLLEMFDNFDLFNDQMKELKNKSNCKLYLEKNKFDKKMQGFWCEFVDQENTSNKIHQYYIENRTCFTPAMITLFNMNMDLEINKKVNDQLEEFEIIKIEKNENFVIFVIKQKTIKSFLNSSKYFFNVLIYKRNNEGVYKRIVTSVQLTELFKDEYYKQLSDQLDPQMLTIMNVQQFIKENDDILIIDSSRIDPLNQVGFKLAKGFMKKVFKKYAYDYKKQLVEFIINQKKKGLNQNLVWFNNDEKEIKSIIKENFNLINDSNIEFNKLSEDVKILYQNKSMINSDLLDSDNLSDIQEIKNSKSEFKLFDYTLKQNTTNKIDSFDIDNADMSPIKLSDDQIQKKERDDKIIKFFQQNQNQQIENKETPFSIQNSEVFKNKEEPEEQIQDKEFDQIDQEYQTFNNLPENIQLKDEQQDVQSITEKKQDQQDLFNKQENENEQQENDNEQKQQENVNDQQQQQDNDNEQQQEIISEQKQIQDDNNSQIKINDNEQIEQNINNEQEQKSINLQQDEQQIEIQNNQNREQIIMEQQDMKIEKDQLEQKIIEQIKKDINEDIIQQSKQEIVQENQEEIKDELKGIQEEQNIQENKDQQQQNSSQDYIDIQNIKNQNEQQNNIDTKQIQNVPEDQEQKINNIINDSFLSNQIPSDEQIVKDQNKENINVQQFTQNFINNLIEEVVEKASLKVNQEQNNKNEEGQHESTNINSLDNLTNIQQQTRLQKDMNIIEEKGGSFEDIDN